MIRECNISSSFWQGKRVFLTGHTGFKGSWLSQWLLQMGAEVKGYALAPPHDGSPDGYQSLFDELRLSQNMDHQVNDIRDRDRLLSALKSFKPDIVFHMAAQPLVRESYVNPAYTYEVNVMGTINLLEACKASDGVRSIIIVTSDKCYQNVEKIWGYQENDPMGGFDPYSNSKGCSELVTSAYRSSFFNPNDYKQHGVCLATARAGNVIGGGDWSIDRLIPDMMRVHHEGQKLTIRNPKAIRPWQHVLEPLRGYLMLAEQAQENGPTISSGWNFGPDNGQFISVEQVVTLFQEHLPNFQGVQCVHANEEPHEAGLLRLDCTKAVVKLGWTPRLTIQDMVRLTSEWYSEQSSEARRHIINKQINEFG